MLNIFNFRTVICNYTDSCKLRKQKVCKKCTRNQSSGMKDFYQKEKKRDLLVD